MKKTPLELALQRSQVALHEATLEVGRLKDLEERVKRAFSKWEWDGDAKEWISVPVNTDLLSIIPSK